MPQEKDPEYKPSAEKKLAEFSVNSADGGGEQPAGKASDLLLAKIADQTVADQWRNASAEEKHLLATMFDKSTDKNAPWRGVDKQSPKRKPG